MSKTLLTALVAVAFTYLREVIDNPLKRDILVAMMIVIIILIWNV